MRSVDDPDSYWHSWFSLQATSFNADTHGSSVLLLQMDALEDFLEGNSDDCSPILDD